MKQMWINFSDAVAYIGGCGVLLPENALLEQLRRGSIQALAEVVKREKLVKIEESLVEPAKLKSSVYLGRPERFLHLIEDIYPLAVGNHILTARGYNYLVLRQPEIASIYFDNGGFQSSFKETLTPGLWSLTNLKMTQSEVLAYELETRTQIRCLGVVVDYQALMGIQFVSSEATLAQSKRGRPLKYDWEAAEKEMRTYIRQRRPKTQATVLAHIDSWFLGRQSESPAHSTSAEHLAPIWREYLRTSNSRL